MCCSATWNFSYCLTPFVVYFSFNGYRVTVHTGTSSLRSPGTSHAIYSAVVTVFLLNQLTRFILFLNQGITIYSDKKVLKGKQFSQAIRSAVERVLILNQFTNVILFLNILYSTKMVKLHGPMISKYFKTKYLT